MKGLNEGQKNCKLIFNSEFPDFKNLLQKFLIEQIVDEFFVNDISVRTEECWSRNRIQTQISVFLPQAI